MKAPTDPFTLADHLVDDHGASDDVAELEGEAMRELHARLHRAPMVAMGHDHPDL